MVLSIDSIDFAYKDTQIFKNFSLKVYKGEILAILGSSGSGKTTLLELICKNLKPNKGEINCENLAMISQDPYTSFHQSFSIINQIRDVAKIPKKSELLEILKNLNLNEDNIYKKPEFLSGGLLQRCSILRAILMHPKVLLCDEPSSALDNIISLNLMKFLLKYLDNLAIILITHDEDLASWCASRTIKLDK